MMPKRGIESELFTHENDALTARPQLESLSHIKMIDVISLYIYIYVWNCTLNGRVGIPKNLGAFI